MPSVCELYRAKCQSSTIVASTLGAEVHPDVNSPKLASHRSAVTGGKGVRAGNTLLTWTAFMPNFSCRQGKKIPQHVSPGAERGCARVGVAVMSIAVVRGGL